MKSNRHLNTKDTQLTEFQPFIEADNTILGLKAIINTMGDWVFVKDDKSRLLIVNDAFCEFFQMTEEQAIGKTLYEDIAQEEQESFMSIDKQVIETGIENIRDETISFRGGEMINISTRKNRLIGKDGKRYLVGVVRDITEVVKARNALKKSQEQLEKEIAAKDKLISVIAHDLRNPLQGIIQLVDMMYTTINGDDQKAREDLIDLIKSSTTNALTLSQNLLDWAQAQKGAIKAEEKTYTLQDILSQQLDSLALLAKNKNIEIVKDYNASDIVKTDKRLFQTIVRNLVTNAIKFTLNNGSICLSISNQSGELRVKVTDTGVGMSNDQKNNLFDFLTNTSSVGTRKEQGTGMGLVLCHEFTRLFGGKIQVESQVGEGSTFIVSLPQ